MQVQLGQKPKKNTYYVYLIEIVIVTIVYVVLKYLNLRIFYLPSNDSYSILGTLLQSSVTIIAILFSLLLFVSESYIGKYVPSSLKYVINNPQSVSLLLLYIMQILFNLFSLIYYNTVMVDMTILLFIACIFCLMPYYIAMNKIFNPKTIIDHASNVDFEDHSTLEDSVRLIYQITLNLIKNNEIVDAIYGINKITELVTKENVDNKFNAWSINYLERIAVVGFDYDPTITETVIKNYGVLLNHLKTKISFIIGNFSRYLSSSCNKINKLTGDHIYSEPSLMMSYQLYNNVYVEKSIAGYGFGFPYELQYINDAMEMMKKIEMEDYKISGGMVIDDAIRRMIKEDKDDDAYRLIVFYLEALPSDNYSLLEICTSILREFPIEKEGLAIKCIKKIKELRGDLKITLVENDNKTGSNISTPQGELKIETGMPDLIKKVEWLRAVFKH